MLILLCIVNIIRHLICGNNLNWRLNLNLIYKRLWTGAGSGLLISMLRKLNWFHLTSLITLVLSIWKWMGLVLMKNDLLKCWGWLFLLNWIGVPTLSLLLKPPSRKLEPWFILGSFFLLRLLCIFYQSTILSCMEYCCHVCTGARSCYLEFLDKHEFGRCLSELAQLFPRPFSWGRSTGYSDRLHDFSVTIPRCYKDVYVNSLFPHTARPWNSLPIECFSLAYNLNGF